VGLLEAGVAGELPERAVQLLKIAHSESERLIRLINDILDIKKIEAGKLDLKFGLLPVAALIKDAISATALLGDPVNVKLSSKISKEGDLRCDRDRILQVLTNLISNAIKFSPRDSEVLIIVEAGTKNGFRFSVIDHGEGIAEHDMPKLFGLFQQLDSSDSRPKGGTGLGLAISKAIVEQHNGTIGVESVVGQGTTFWFELPSA
jgi:signal transduction histidine kinase